MKIVFRNATKFDFEVLCRICEKPYDGLEAARKLVEMYGKIVGGLIWFPRE